MYYRLKDRYCLRGWELLPYALLDAKLVDQMSQSNYHEKENETMNENLKKFLEEASKNEELKARLAALTDKETAVAKAIEIAKEYGFTLTAEDFQPADGAELSLDELESVAGGDAWCLAGWPGQDSSNCCCAMFGNG
ncbi:MAG: Nif11-like leader peptide family RiPP precursor [Oscillospiraceae bacterium]|nr:Nif11-like leader peptide family RiPP precursor [Oscillospiraceae bacterium]